MKTNLNPFKQVGVFKINDNIDNYIGKYNFEIDDYSKEEISPSINYTLNNPQITLFVNDKNLIDSIGCYEELIYKHKNLIGMSLDEFIIHTGEKHYGDVDILDFEEDDIPQYVYEFEDIGLQVWIKNNDGKIVTIIVSDLNQEKEVENITQISSIHKTHQGKDYSKE